MPTKRRKNKDVKILLVAIPILNPKDREREEKKNPFHQVL